MQISKFLLGWCAAAISFVPLCVLATDSPEQARAREALRQKMAEMGVPQGMPQTQAPTEAARVAATNAAVYKKAREQLRQRSAAQEAKQPMPRPLEAPAGQMPKEKAAPAQMAAQPVVTPSAAPAPGAALVLPEAEKAAPAGSLPAPQTVVVKQPSEQVETPKAEQPVVQKWEGESRQWRKEGGEPYWGRAEVLPPSDSAAIQRARDQMRQKMAEQEGWEKEEGHVLAAPKNAEAEEKAMKEAKAKEKQVQRWKQTEKEQVSRPAAAYKPLEPPEMPISAAKQQELADLLVRYKADEVTPEQYHAERARILAEP
jgi:hypothetical protein